MDAFSFLIGMVYAFAVLYLVREYRSILTRLHQLEINWRLFKIADQTKGQAA